MFLILRCVVILSAYILDILLGDPKLILHPVVLIGKLISGTEKGLRIILRIDDKRESQKLRKRFMSVVLVIIVLFVCTAIPLMLLICVYRLNTAAGIILEAFMCYQLLCTKSLYEESMKVKRALDDGDIVKARYAVSMIVGRDTKRLDDKGIARAAVETVAENTSDGIIAPLVYMFVFGAAGGYFYKTVNTMDSMVGYKNDKYLYVGFAAAKLDDFLNFLPSRLSAVFMTASAFLLKYDYKNAWKIYKRDRKKHASPNSAQTESVCAGALGLKLLGDAWYFGKLYHKEYIGDEIREIEPEDIRRANCLMVMTGVITLVVGICVEFMVAKFIIMG